jgi:hypothetical protein
MEKRRWEAEEGESACSRMEKTSRGRDEVPIKYNGYSRIILVATWKEEQRGVTSNWWSFLQGLRCVA